MLSIIIVNYNSASLILDLLHSFYAQQNNYDYEIIIVDNQSKDDSEMLITLAFPQVKWLQMGYNSGFARANNAGIRIAKGDAVLLLNPDTIVMDNAIEKCYKGFITDKYPACGIQLLNADLTPQISGNYFMKGGLNHLLPLPYWGSVLRALALSYSNKKTNIPDAKDTVEVDWISGAFLMVKKSAIEKAGLMDEDFFLYAEEVEWCSRLRKLGDLCIYGDIRMVHLLGETITSTAKSDDKTYFNIYDKKGLQLVVSNHVRIRKQYGVFWFLFQLLNYSFGAIIFYIVGFFHNLFTLKNPLAHFSKATGLAKNVLKVWQLLPEIISNKPYFYKMLG